MTTQRLDPSDVVVDRRATGRLLRRIVVVTGVLDGVVLFAAAVLARTTRPVFAAWWDLAPAADSMMTWSGFAVVGAWLVVLAAHGAYNLRHFGSGPEEFRVVARASMVTAGLVGITCYLFQLPVPRVFAVLLFVLGTPMLLLSRYAVRKVAHRARYRGRLLHRVVAIGGPSGVAEVVDALRRSRFVGYEIVGAALPQGIAFEPERFVVPVLGSVEDVRAICDRVGADTVLITRGGYDSAQQLRRTAWALEGSDIDLVVVPSLTDVAGPRIHMRPVAGLPLLHVEQPQAGAAAGLTKRLFDLVFASVALVMLSPVLAILAALVKLHDGGPVLFLQRRVGRDGRQFGMVKFRSMVVDAEQQLEDLRSDNEHDGVLFKIQRDPRITPVGRVLRQFSLDELPQLVNVLRGEMSLVGPRPPLPSEVAQYHDDVHRRLLVRPGLTGLWQVSGRSSLTWDESVRLDLYYVDNWSMTSDLVIIAKTIRAVLARSGAY